MAYQVDKDFGAHVEIATKLEDLLNAATISTLHACGIVKVRHDYYLAWIAYE